MRDIVATIQAEQDASSAPPLAGVLVVQGGPGTGKTAVALHRAAYLLYTHRDRLARSGVLVVGPSPVFLRYIEQVLPVARRDRRRAGHARRSCSPASRPPGAEPPAVAALKGDLRMAKVLARRSAHRQRVPARAGARSCSTAPGSRSPPAPSPSARARARQSGRPHNEARVAFVKHVLDDLAAQLAEQLAG